MTGNASGRRIRWRRYTIEVHDLEERLAELEKAADNVDPGGPRRMRRV